MTLNFRNSCPEPRGEINFNLPPISKTKFYNNLPVYFIHKANLPVVQLGIIINAGSKYDNIEKYGTAKLTAMLLDEGAGKYSALQIDSEFESLGTIFNISTDKDSTIITMLSLTENFERSFELLSDIIKEPHFSENEFDREKKKLLTQLLQLRDKPQYLAHTNFERIIFRNTPYANPVSGNLDSLENILIPDLKNCYSDFYGINNAEIIVVGDITENKLFSIFEKHISDWETSETPNFDMPKLTVKESNTFIIHRENSPQTQIYLGHDSTGRNSSDFFAKSLMNTILGGQFTSRLNLNLREKRGFTYGVHSAFGYNKGIGQFYVSTSVKAENTGESVSEILKEISNIRKNISEKEIEFAKSYLIKRFPSQFETYSQLVHNLALLSIHSLPTDYFNHYVSNMNSLNMEDVILAAKTNLRENCFSTVLVGDKNLIVPQLESSYIELDLTGDVVTKQ